MEKILIIKLGAMGDFIQSLGPMKAIRAHHPQAHITLLTTKPFANLARESKYVDAIHLDERPKWHDVRGWMSLRHWLRAGKFTRVYDLQNNDRTQFYFNLYPRNERPEWVGVAKGASHRNISPDRTAGLAFEGHAQTLRLAGIENVAIDDLSWIRRDLTAYKVASPYVLLVPGSAPQHPYKRWPAIHYGRLAASLERRGFYPVILGTKGEVDIAQAITRLSPGTINLCGMTDLEDIAVLARGAAAAIGNDTGPMHMIAPTGCPCIVLFSGRTNPARHRPLGPAISVMQSENLDDLGVNDVLTRVQNIARSPDQA